MKQARNIEYTSLRKAVTSLPGSIEQRTIDIVMMDPLTWHLSVCYVYPRTDIKLPTVPRAKAQLCLHYFMSPTNIIIPLLPSQILSYNSVS